MKVEALQDVADGLVPVAVAARLAHVGRMTVRRAVDAGELDGVRVPGGPRLVVRADVDRWAAARGVRAA